MATITEDYVSFEIARLLKKKGFQQLQDNCGYFTTEMVYSINADDNGEHHFAHQYPAGVYNKDKYIAAPTLQMVMKWLRKEKGVAITPIISSVLDNEKFLWDVEITVAKTNETYNQGWVYEIYEQACEAAIKYCLENLI